MNPVVFHMVSGVLDPRVSTGTDAGPEKNMHRMKKLQKGFELSVERSIITMRTEFSISNGDLYDLHRHFY